MYVVEHQCASRTAVVVRHIIVMEINSHTHTEPGSILSETELRNGGNWG